MTEQYGDCDGTPSIVRLLEAVRADVGNDIQAEIDKLIYAIEPNDDLGIIAGHYRLLRKIGDKSRQANVYYALDTNDPEGLPVVVKLFKVRDGDYKTRFLEDVRSVR
jgi:hypothetical protein